MLLCRSALAAGPPVDQLVLDLYQRGEYADCRGLVRRLIDDYTARVITVPVREMATVYLVAACLADVFRDAGYAEAVDDNLRIALEMDPNVDPSPAESRALVKARFAEIRAEMLASKGPTGRRFSVGPVLSLAGPAGLHWRDRPILGLQIGAGILPWLSVEGSAAWPVQAAPSDEVQLSLAGIVRPAFALGRPMLVLDFAYVAVRELAWTYGVSFSLGAEVATRSGLGLRVAAELLRIEGAAAPDPEPGDYPVIVLFGQPLTIGLPGIALSAVYAF
jgi:hypothetical protein